MMTYQVDSQMRRDKKRQDDSKKNPGIAKNSSLKNAKKPGVVSIDGIQYKNYY
jgi:ribosomal protein L32